MRKKSKKIKKKKNKNILNFDKSGLGQLEGGDSKMWTKKFFIRLATKCG